MLVRGLISLVLVILAGYGMFEAAPLIRGPVLTLQTPEFLYSEDGFVTITGTATHATALTLNDGPLPIDEEGYFSRLIVLPRGGAILSLSASDRFGRAVSKRITVTVP